MPIIRRHLFVLSLSLGFPSTSIATPPLNSDPPFIKPLTSLYPACDVRPPEVASPKIRQFPGSDLCEVSGSLTPPQSPQITDKQRSTVRWYDTCQEPGLYPLNELRTDETLLIGSLSLGSEFGPQRNTTRIWSVKYKDEESGITKVRCGPRQKRFNEFMGELGEVGLMPDIMCVQDMSPRQVQNLSYHLKRAAIASASNYSKERGSIRYEPGGQDAKGKLRYSDQAGEVHGIFYNPKVVKLVAWDVKWLGKDSDAPAPALDDLQPFEAKRDFKKINAASVEERYGSTYNRIVQFAHFRGVSAPSQSWVVANTHLDFSSHKARKKQVSSLTTSMQRFMRTNDLMGMEHRRILAGNFSMYPDAQGDELYQEILGATSLYDSRRKAPVGQYYGMPGTYSGFNSSQYRAQGGHEVAYINDQGNRETFTTLETVTHDLILGDGDTEFMAHFSLPMEIQPDRSLLLDGILHNTDTLRVCCDHFLQMSLIKRQPSSPGTPSCAHADPEDACEGE